VPQVGTVIADRYVLRERLGGGGTGEVWLAAVSSNGASDAPTSPIGADGRVVVKLLADDIEPPPRGSALIELLRQGRADGQACLVLEYVPGGNLRDLLRRHGRLGQRQAMSLVAQAAAALHTAHLSGVVHRDLRPEHLLMRADGSIAIADAGLAPGWWSQPNATRWAARAPYVAPEQVRGASVTALTDVYALGIIAYECVTGRPPFEGATAAATATRHTRDEPPPLPAEIVPAVRDVVLRALAKDPDSRWPTAQALAEEATRATAVAPLAAGLPSPAPLAPARPAPAAVAPAALAPPSRSLSPVAPADREPAPFRRVASTGGAATPSTAPEFRVVRGPAPTQPAVPLPARAGTLVSSAAARAARMPTMNLNETTLDTLPPVPPLPPERRFPQPRYLAIAGAAAVVLLALVFAVPGLANRGGTADPPPADIVPSLGASPNGSQPITPTTDAAVPDSASASAGPAPATTAKPPAATTTVPGQPPLPAPPTAPGVVTYKVAGNGLSPEFKDGSCVYRIWYSNIGSTPFGKLRIYSLDNCLSASVLVAAQRGTTVSYESVGGPGVSQNTDSCGKYFEIQATASSTPAFAVGMSIRFAVTGHTTVFSVDHGIAPTVMKSC
jgi:eukaryotic-like serine/threonine-protein kinase